MGDVDFIGYHKFEQLLSETTQSHQAAKLALKATIRASK